MAGKAEARISPITTLSGPVQNRLAKGRIRVNGKRAEDGEPDHVLAPESVANRAADDGAERHGAQENEQVKLRAGSTEVWKRLIR